MFNQPLCAVFFTAQSGYIFLIMKNFLLIAFMLLITSVAIKAQTMHTFSLDSTHYWSTPYLTHTDTTVFIQYGDSLCLRDLTGVVEPTNHWHFWVNDTTIDEPPPYFLFNAIPLDTVLRIIFLNDSTCLWVQADWTTVSITFNSPHENLSFLRSSSNGYEYARRFFFIYPSGNVSVGEQKGNDINEIILFPSPVNEILSLKGNIENGTTFTVVDLSGRSLKTGFLISNHIDVSELPSGVYLLNLTMAGTQRSFKFIKN